MSVEELGAYGLDEMTNAEIRAFLSNRRTGVLGLPSDGAPYLLPLSYGYDGDDSLYFTYLLGSSSRKASETDAAEGASFLVFQVDTMYNWESVLLRGRLSPVPESEWDDLAEVLDGAWRPDLFEGADLSGGVQVYELRVDERTGIKHEGLPPALERETD